MPENLLLSLQITLVGMGLVFGAIILLWGLMSMLVRVTADRPEQGKTLRVSDNTKRLDEHDLKRKAAVAGVSVALAMSKQAPPQPHFPLPPTAIVSAWQAVMRAGQLKQRGPRR